MVGQNAIVDKVVAWLERFGHALENWESWLVQIEEAYLSGDFNQLVELESVGLVIQSELADTQKERAELIQAAAARGVVATSITALVRRLEPQIPLQAKSQLRLLNQQLRRAQQMSAALWISGFQAAGYTTALLNILATGNADRATYSPGEREALEGGHIMDEAA
jgi:hypothetical protein